MKQDRIKVNETFAYFLGWEAESAFTTTNTSRFHRYLSPHTFSWISAASMKFDKSWDWLMPVWYKFRDLKFEGETPSKLHTNYVARLSQDITYGTIEEFYHNLFIATDWALQQKK